MKIKDIGEFGFIERLAEKFKGLQPEGQRGIGDDCAVYPVTNERSALLTTDLLVENIHFLRDRLKPEELGYKSLAVNLSDIAAMGGKATGSYLSLAIPEEMEVEWLDGFMDGYRELSEKYRVPLMGGDTTRSPDMLVVNVCVTGEQENRLIKYRHTALAGDLLCTTGNLGDSAGGLQVLLKDIPRGGMQELLVQRHHKPEPALKEGAWLAQQDAVHAMMDLSDGMDSDLRHILKASGLSAEICLEKLPLSKELKRVCWEWRWNVYELAVAGGEDYQLLFSLDPQAFEAVSREYESVFQKPLYMLGQLKTGIGDIQYLLHEKEIKLTGEGFRHF